MRVYILTDMEGISGIVRSEQVSGAGPEYEEARHLLTEDINAAIEGALKGGAIEVVVNDLHGARGGCNLIPDELHPEAKYIWGHARYRHPPLENRFDCAFLIGYHAMAGSDKGVLSHTMSSRSIYRIQVNGIDVGEIAIDSAILGSFNMPVTLVTGCSEAVKEAKRFLGDDIETVAVKEALGRFDAICLAPAKAHKLIKEAAERAVRKAKSIKPFRFKSPVEVIIEYFHSNFADPLSRLPNAERVGPRSVKIIADNFLEAAKLLGWY